MKKMYEFELQGHTSVHGIEIDIENKAGSVRSGVDKDGHEWHTDMHFDYGYIVGATGKDKDEVDVYVGPTPESELVFIVHQNDPVTGAFDEDKVMLGFNSADEAKAAYLSQYDRPGFFGTMDETDINTFRTEVFNPDRQEKKLGILTNDEMDARLNRPSDEVLGYEGAVVRSIKIEQEFKIPGTDIIVEKGDTLRIKAEKDLGSIPGLQHKIDHQFSGKVDQAFTAMVDFFSDNPAGQKLLWDFVRRG